MSAKPKRIVKKVTCQKCGKAMYPNWVTRHVCGESESYVRKYTPKPKLVMSCPNGWKNCPDCKYISPNNTCLYPKSDLDIVVLAAKIAEEVVTKDAKKSAERIMLSWTDWHDYQRQINLLSEDEKWLHMFGNPAPHINFKETLNGGPSEPGGGSKSRVPPKPPYKVPEYLKLFGQ